MNKKKIFAGLITLVLTVGLLAPFAVTWGALNDPGSINMPKLDNAIDTEAAIEKIINFFTGLLLTIAVIVILIGGFKWMTAAGNKDKVESAKKTVIGGCIGLIIVVSAWLIVRLVGGAGDWFTNIVT